MGHISRVVTLSPPTSEMGVQISTLLQVKKLVVACHWLAIYCDHKGPGEENNKEIWMFKIILDHQKISYPVKQTGGLQAV